MRSSVTSAPHVPGNRSEPRIRALREPVVPSPVLGVLVAIACEVMFFGGLISAYVIGEASAPAGWPPPDEPRLPVEATAVNSVGLLCSGIAAWLAGRAWPAAMQRARRALGIAAVLGTVFVLVQGYEWARLIARGLTMQTSAHGSFFYLLVGAHAVHVAVGLVFLLRAYLQMTHFTLAAASFQAVRLFWYFVVLLWPLLYVLVYL
ncbi:MAG: heme-copper oxidase subunit III [Myxococcales bacterium]|nr:heme-copper oxidase subunit III [Myxococcales bacterium]